jgi:hypothetical protein
MRTPKTVDCLWLEATCADLSLVRWESWMYGATRADKRRIDRLVKRHLPELGQGLALNLRNPYRYRKTRRHLILVHSGIEYFLRYATGADARTNQNDWSET